MKISLKKILFMLMFATCAHEAQASAQQVLATETIGNVAVRVVSSSLQAVIGLLKKNPVKSIAATVIGLAVSMVYIKCIKQIKLLKKVLLRNASIREIQSLLALMNPKIIQVCINQADIYGQTVFHCACSHDNNLEMVKLLLPYCTPETINQASKNENLTALYFACTHDNNLEMVELLLPHCTLETINRAESVRNSTPLWQAVANNNIEIAKRLLPLCTRETINQADIDGQTVLYCACGNDNLEMFRLLLPHCTRETINRPNSRGWTVLHLACQMNKPRIVQALVQHGAQNLLTNPNLGGVRPLDFTNQILANTPLNHAPTATPESRIRRRHAEQIQQLLTGVDHDSAGRRLGRLLAPVGVPGRNSCAK